MLPSDSTVFPTDLFIARLAPSWADLILKERKWILDTKISELNTRMTIPQYLLSPKAQKPLKAAFDPRLTLAFYYDYIATNANSIEPLILPFYWGDWVNTTVLDPYIFDPAQRNITCADLDLRPYQREHFPGLNTEATRTGALHPEFYCNDVPHENNGLGFEIHLFPGRFPAEDAAMVGKAYLYSSAPNPASIVFLTGSGLYHVLLSTEKESLMNGTMVQDYLMRNENAKHINTLHNFKVLQKAVTPSSTPVFGDDEIVLPHEDFILDPMQDLFEVEATSPESLSRHEKMYLDAHRNSMQNDDFPIKYFKEAQIFDSLLGDHYDWRFFGGIQYFNDESANAMSRLARTWLQFARSQGLNTWIAHGSLLSWSFDGMNFPWDPDGDVQMPIKDLQKLALRFNQSLIVENGEEGFGRYFLDCGALITSRTNMDGKNNIDARFIDVDTGFYIDITALAVSNEKPPQRYLAQKEIFETEEWESDTDEMESMGMEMQIVQPEVSQEAVNDALQLYNCRNFHFVKSSELSPLKKTFFEGVAAYVPNDHQTILRNEYGNHGVSDHLYGGVFFVPKLRIWVDTLPLRLFLRYREYWNEYFGIDRDQIRKSVPEMVVQGDLSYQEQQALNNLETEDIADLLLHEKILLQYLQTSELTKFHEAEASNFDGDESSKGRLKNGVNFYPNRPEPSLFRMSNEDSFELTIKTYMKKTRELGPSSWFASLFNL